ncbi:30S ribosomal protein S17 [Candidatus Poriferisodalis sp.]|uniref:30S ribosomal protein S17 n=1 Tax=Candidatus Poriferisodalis sp. TaxID=3101277 RepID=UPI003B01CAF8
MSSDAAETPNSAGPNSTGPNSAQTSSNRPERNRRKVREGIVTSTKMDRTAVVSVTERVRHPRYFKTVQRTKKLYVHDPNSQTSPGDRVRVMETRPISKTKHWRVVEIVERAR